jgi:exonuclease III
MNIAKNPNTAGAIQEASKLQPDILCMQEIHQESGSRVEITAVRGNQELLDKINRTYHIKSYGFILRNSVGIIVFNEYLHVVDLVAHQRFLRLTTTFKPKDLGLPLHAIDPEATHSLIIYSVYAPVNHDDRSVFFAEDLLDLHTLASRDKLTSVIIAGDFNDYDSPILDRFPPIGFDSMTEIGRIKRSWRSLFAPVLDRIGVLDAFRFLYPEASEFSRNHYIRGEFVSATRIDAVLMSNDLLESLVSVNHNETTASDHKSVEACLRITSNMPAPKTISDWKLHPNNCLDFHFKIECQAQANNILKTQAFKGIHFNFETWVFLKEQLRLHAKEISYKFGYLNKDPHVQTQKLRWEINTIQPFIHQASPWMHEQLVLKQQRLEKLRLMFKAEQESIARRSLEMGQLNEKKLCRHRTRNSLGYLRDWRPQPPPDATDTCPHPSDPTVAEVICTFFEHISNPEPLPDPRLPRLFLDRTIHDVRKLSLEQQDMLVAPFQESEVRAALMECKNGKAPGFDGICFEFYKMILDHIIKPFTEMCTATMGVNHPNNTNENGSVRAWPVMKGIMLEKNKPDKEDVRNYRPLTIMDTDLRWRERVLLNRIIQVVETVISPQQTSFVPKRRMIDNVCNLMLALDQARYSEKDVVIIALDQEKVYDRVRWEWLSATLEAMNFPEKFISALMMIYKTPAVRYVVNGEKTCEVQLKCGMLQGGPISVLLYILSTEPLLEALVNNGMDITIAFEGDDLVLRSMAFADDLIVILDSPGDYKKLHDILSVYCEVSNARFNLSKAFAWVVSGKSSVGHWHECLQESIQTPDDNFVYLGCFLRQDGSIPEILLDKLLGRLRQVSHIWNLKEMSLKSRVATLNTSLLSILWYPTQMCPCPKTSAVTWFTLSPHLCSTT